MQPMANEVDQPGPWTMYNFIISREHVASAKNQTKPSATGVYYKNAHKKSSPKLRFRIVCATEKDELRLRIEEALAIRSTKPTLSRRGEETGIDFLP